MGKETIISIIIIIAIIVGNIITKKYTVKSVTDFSKKIEDLKQDIYNLEEQDNLMIEEAKGKVDTIIDDWNKTHDKLAYYIEHDELEKIETNLISLKSFIETNQYSEVISKLDTSVFLLEHIEDKYAVNLQNIF